MKKKVALTILFGAFFSTIAYGGERWERWESNGVDVFYPYEQMGRYPESFPREEGYDRGTSGTYPREYGYPQPQQDSRGYTQGQGNPYQGNPYQPYQQPHPGNSSPYPQGNAPKDYPQVRYPQTQNPLYPSQNPPRGYSDVGGAYPQNPQNPPRGYSGSTYPTPSGKSTYPQNPRQDPREYPQRGYREDPLSVYARGEYPQQNSPNAYGAYGDGGYPSRDPRGYGAYSPPPQRYGYPRTDSDYLRRFEEIVSEYNYGRGRAPVPYNRYQY